MSLTPGKKAEAGPKAYTGNASFQGRLEYGGPRTKVEWCTEVWVQGRQLRPGRWSREVWRPPGADVTFTLSDVRKGAETVFAIESEFEFSDALGGSTTVGGKKQELHPGAKHIVTLSPDLKAPVLFPDTGELVVWAVIASAEPITLPAEATPESAAAGAGWAFLVRLRLAP